MVGRRERKLTDVFHVETRVPKRARRRAVSSLARCAMLTPACNARCCASSAAQRRGARRRCRSRQPVLHCSWPRRKSEGASARATSAWSSFRRRESFRSSRAQMSSEPCPRSSPALQLASNDLAPIYLRLFFLTIVPRPTSGRPAGKLR